MNFPEKLLYFRRFPCSCIFQNFSRKYSALSCYTKTQKTNRLEEKPIIYPKIRHFSLESFRNSYQGLLKSVTESKPVTAVEDALINLHDITGMSWAGTVVCTTIALRCLVTFPLGVYQAFVLARLNLVREEFRGIVEELKHETRFAMEKFNWPEEHARKVYKISLKKQWRILIERDNCHPVKSVLVVFVQLPAWILLSLALRCMSCGYGPDPKRSAWVMEQFNSEQLAWLPSLVVPDPTGILPLSVFLINLTIIEIQAATKDKHNRVQKIITNFFRGMAVISLPIALCVPSCMSLFWSVSSGLALTQNLLLMSPRLRRLFRIPLTEFEQQTPYSNAWKNFKTKWSRK